MDKETLSNYGWIVICVLILAVMIALATPFGHFIAGAIKSTTAGFFSVNQNALNSTGLINMPDQKFDDENGGGNGGSENVNANKLQFGVIYENNTNPDEVIGIIFYENGDCFITVNDIFKEGLTNAFTYDEANNLIEVQGLPTFTVNDNSVVSDAFGTLIKTNKSFVFTNNLRHRNAEGIEYDVTYRDVYKSYDDDNLEYEDLMSKSWYYDIDENLYCYTEDTYDTLEDYFYLCQPSEFGILSNGRFVREEGFILSILVIEDGVTVLHCDGVRYVETVTKVEK